MLNFPSSPVDGQEYDNWVYNTAKGAWLAKPLEPMAAVPSPVAPATPQPGDMWFNTNEATTYVYYDDGNTSQWVEMVAQTGLTSPLAVTQGGTGATTVAGAQDSLRVGLVPISPSGVAAVGGGTATVNTLGQVSFLDTPKVQLADVFSSAYRNYRVLLTASTGTNVGVSFRLFTGSIASPPSEAITNYNWTLTQNNGSAITVNAASSQSNAFVGSSAGQTAAAYDIFNPNVNRLTRLVGQTYGFSTNDTTYFGGAFHNAAFQATGLSFFTTNGTNMEGNIQVFGYND